MDLNEHFKGDFSLEFVGHGGSIKVVLEGATFLSNGLPAFLKSKGGVMYNWSTITVATKLESENN